MIRINQEQFPLTGFFAADRVIVPAPVAGLALASHSASMSAPRTTAQLIRHAHALVGTSLADLADGLGLAVPVGHVRTKGWSGQIIERELGAGDGGEHGPDFAELGLELKTVPVNQDLVPLESTAVCLIDPIAIAAESWASSYVRHKLAKVLFVALAVPDRLAPVADRRVAAVALWSPSPEQEAILAADFELFVTSFFRAGPRGRADRPSWPGCCRFAPKDATPRTCAAPMVPMASQFGWANVAFTFAPGSWVVFSGTPPPGPPPSQRLASFLVLNVPFFPHVDEKTYAHCQ